MKVDDLRTFLVVAEELHFGRAAIALGTSQPAISRRIRSLETDIGAELFTRTSKQVSLTPAGLAFRADAVDIVERADEAQRRAQRVARGLIGHVRLAAVPGAIAGFVPDVIRTHRREHGSIGLSLYELDPRSQIERLRRSELDIGFVRGNWTADDLVAEPLHQENMGVAVPTAHPFARRDSISISDLKAERLIIPARDHSFTYNRIVTACHASGFEPQIVQEATSVVGLLGLVSAELGIAILATDFRPLLSERMRLIPLQDIEVVLSMLSRPNPAAAVVPLLRTARAVSATLALPVTQRQL